MELLKMVMFLTYHARQQFITEKLLITI